MKASADKNAECQLVTIVVSCYSQCVAASHSGRRSEGPPVVIRRPTHALPKTQTRVSAIDNMNTDEKHQDASLSSQSKDLEGSGMSKIRHLLRPPSIEGLTDWGIPAEPSEPCDPALEVLLVTTRISDMLTVFVDKACSFPHS